MKSTNFAHVICTKHLIANDATENARESMSLMLGLFAIMCTTTKAETIATVVVSQTRGVNTEVYPFQSVSMDFSSR